MAFPIIQINSSTGSDTAASGAGPATALTGTAASFTGVPSVVTLDGSPSLAGVAVDGSHVLWILTSTGRQFSAITAKDDVAKTVTVADTLAGTATGRTWGIGGKRATLDNTNTRNLGNDVKAGWSIDIQDGQTLTSVFQFVIGTSSVTALKPVTVYSSAGTRPLITTSTNSVNLIGIRGDPIIFKHLSFSNTAGTKGTYAGGTGMGLAAIGGSCNGITAIDCIFDGFVSAIMGDNVVDYAISRLQLVASEVKNCTDRGVGLQGGAQQTVYEFDHVYIHSNTGDGVRIMGACPASFKHSVFASNGGRGVYQSGGGGAQGWPVTVSNCDFKGNANAGIEWGGTQFSWACTDSIFVSNGDYGIKLASIESTDTSGIPAPLSLNNAFYNNTNGTVDFALETASITLTGDPFNSSSDFGLNSTAGAGASCKGAALTAPGASANTPGDIGAIPSGGGAASGGGPAYFAR